MSENIKMEDLLKGARKVMECGCAKAGEKILIVTDTQASPRTALALLQAANELKAEPVIMTMNQAAPGGELPHVVNEAMKKADLIIAPTSTSIYHSKGCEVACEEPYSARLIALSELPEEAMVNGGINCDFMGLRPEIKKITDIFTAGSKLSFKTPGGTDISASIKGRYGCGNDGITDAPGIKMGLPTFEVFIAPVEESVEGTIVVDASCSGGIGVIKEPIVMKVEKGKVVSVDGGEEAAKLKKLLEDAGTPSAYQVAEIAVGMNPQARITGFINEDEGKYGTGHMALGNNTGFGGVSSAPLHIDMVQWKPTITIDDLVIFRDGEQAVK